MECKTPISLKKEHEELHAMLKQAIQLSAKTGEAATFLQCIKVVQRSGCYTGRMTKIEHISVPSLAAITQEQTNMKKKNSTKNKKVENQAAEKLPVENKPAINGQKSEKDVAFKQMEKDLNSKILKITMWIKDHNPELSPYLEEMPVTVPSESDSEITLNQLKSYYESLKSLLKEYNVDYSKIED